MARGHAARMGVVEIEHPGPVKHWDADRDETEAQRLDRNWSSLLQVLDGTMRTVYLITVACSIGSTVLLVAPVGMHRVLFRRHRLDAIVSISHACAIAGLILLGLALAGVAVVIFDAVVGPTGGWIAGGCTVAAFVALWFVVPLPLRRRSDKSY